MNRKYLFGVIGLILGIAMSFAWTRSYNNNNAQASSSGAGGAGQPGAMGGAVDQQKMMGDVAKIIEDAKNNPKSFEAQIQAARSFYQIGRFDETVEYLEKAYEADPAKTAEQGALGFIGQHYFDKKNFPESEKWLRLAITAESENANKAEMHVVLAKTFLQREPAQPDKAVTELQSALKLAPKDAHAAAHLVEAHALRKDANAADAALNQLKGLEPQNQRIPALEKLIADVRAGKPITLPKEVPHGEMGR